MSHDDPPAWCSQEAHRISVDVGVVEAAVQLAHELALFQQQRLGAKPLVDDGPGAIAQRRCRVELVCPIDIRSCRYTIETVVGPSGNPVDEYIAIPCER